MTDQREAKEGFAAREGTSPLDINACVAEMTRITQIPLRVVAGDGGYAIEDASEGFGRRVENVAFGDDPLIHGGEILTLRADPAGEGTFLIYFQQILRTKIVRSTGLRYCWSGGLWRADFASDAGGDRMEVSREDQGAPVIPLVVTEREGRFALSSPGGFFGERTLEIIPDGGRFSARVRGHGVHGIPPTYGLTREFHHWVETLGWIQSRVEVTRRGNGEIIIKLHCALPRQDGNRNIDISVAVSQGDLAATNILKRALFEPKKLTAMVSAKGL